MDLIVGENTYMSLDEANEIINYLLPCDEKTIWEQMKNEEKESIIVGSTFLYDNNKMEYKGNKVNEDQSLQFPRNINNKIVECPKDIKIGLLLLGLNNVKNNNSKEYKLREQGVTKYKINHAEIDFKDKDLNDKNSIGIYTKIWYEYFDEYSNFGKYVAI